MRKLTIAGAALICGLIVGILWGPVIDRWLNRDRYRGEVRALYDSLQPGMTREQVRREMESGKYRHLAFEHGSHLWLASAPTEIGAGNWVLAVEFKGDQVAAVRVCIADTLEEFYRPVEAPSDKVRPGGTHE